MNKLGERDSSVGDRNFGYVDETILDSRKMHYYGVALAHP